MLCRPICRSTTTSWLIEHNRHWIQAECYRTAGQLHFFLTIPPGTIAQLLPPIQKTRAGLDATADNVILRCHELQTVQGMCGYQLLEALYTRLRIGLPALSPNQELELQHAILSPRFQHIWVASNQAWQQAGPPEPLRQWHKPCEGGTSSESAETNFRPNTQQLEQLMPWIQLNPPSNKRARQLPRTSPTMTSYGPMIHWKRTAHKVSQARWEDLTILTPSPFHGSDSRPMQQTHRLQVTQARGWHCSHNEATHCRPRQACRLARQCITHSNR